LHVATSPDGRWIAGVTPDAIVLLWDHDKRTIRTMDGPQSAPNFLAFSHDSTILFGAVGNEGTVWLWDITKLEPKLLVIEATEGCSVEAVAVHPNGQWLLCGGVDFLSTSGTTGNVCLWDLASKKRILSIPDGATCLAFDASGDRFAFATPDGNVLIASTVTGDLLLEIEGRDGEQINDLVFCPEGNSLIGAASDSTLRVWDTESGELLGCRQFGIPIHSLVIDHQGRLFAGNENTTCFELAPTRLNELS
jgi:WD40 repeat protein